MTFIANARMYAVSPEAEAAWQSLIAHVAEDAGTSFDYQTYEAPQPLEKLWRRSDVGCVQMCGYPIALKIADVVPLASPVPAAPWAHGNAVYRTDLIVKKDAPFRNLADTFSGTVGWTVEHSHSGFNALRHHLLAHRSDDRPQIFRQTVGNLVTARRVLEACAMARLISGHWMLIGTCSSESIGPNWQRASASWNQPQPHRCRLSSRHRTFPPKSSTACVSRFLALSRGPGLINLGARF